MLHALENALIQVFNRVCKKRASSSYSSTTFSDPEPDATLIGQTLPFVSAPAVSASKADGSLIHVAPPFSTQEVVLPFERRLQHVYLLGATGTGKTTLLLRLLESDIAHRRSICVVDLRGDLIERILPRLVAAAPPSEWEKRLMFLDLRDEKFAVGFNPLAGESDVHSRALHVFDVIKAQVDASGVRWEETLRNALLALAFGGWTLLEVEPLLTDAAFRNHVLSQVNDERVKAFWKERFGNLSPTQKSQYASEVLNKITPLLFTPTLRRVLGQRQAPPFRSLLAEPGQVALVSLAVDRLHGAAQLAGALFVSAFQSAVMTSERADKPCPPLSLYVDEFQTMATEKFETIVSEGRRFGLGLALSHQNAHQLDAKLLSCLRNVVGTYFYFQTGAGDASGLTSEVVIGTNGATRAEILATLISQKTGQAFLVRRGEPSVRVQVAPCPDPRVSREAVEELKQVARLNFARSTAEIDRELAKRVSDCRQIPRVPAPPLSPGSALASKPIIMPTLATAPSPAPVGEDEPSPSPSPSALAPPEPMLRPPSPEAATASEAASTPVTPRRQSVADRLLAKEAAQGAASPDIRDEDLERFQARDSNDTEE